MIRYTVCSSMNITQGLDFILSHLESLWPKMVSTHLTDNAQIPVCSPEELEKINTLRMLRRN